MHRAIAVQHELCDLLTGELATARLGAPSIPAATALAFLSWFMLETGQYGEALNAGDRALDIATREQDAYAEVLARSSMSRTLLALNRNADAVGCLTVAREITERNGYDAIHANLSGRIAIALTRTGRAVEAVSIVEACIESGMHHRTGKIELFYLYAGYAEALYAAGSHTMAFAALDEAMAVARAAHNPCLIVEGLGLRGRLRRAGAHDDASSAARLNAGSTRKRRRRRSRRRSLRPRRTVPRGREAARVEVAEGPGGGGPLDAGAGGALAGRVLGGGVAGGGADVAG